MGGSGKEGRYGGVVNIYDGAVITIKMRARSVVKKSLLTKLPVQTHTLSKRSEGKQSTKFNIENSHNCNRNNSPWC